MTGDEAQDAELALLRCEACGLTTGVPMADTEGSRIIECSHCGGSIYWHHCEQCGLGYVGGAEARCPVCDGDPLEELEIV